MKVKNLLAIAAQCDTEEAAEQLLDALKSNFSESDAIASLVDANDEAMMEGDSPFVSVEFNHVISDHYITMIRPEIRFGKLSIVVATNHMRDGLGMFSQSYDVIEDMDEAFDADDDDTIVSVAAKAKEMAIAHHATLIERVGVPPLIAQAAAQESWPKKA